MSSGISDRLRLALAARVHVGVHVEEIDDALQLVLVPDRDLHRDAAVRELAAELLERREEVRALAVEHGHEDDAAEAERVGALPEPRRLHLDAVDAVDREERALDDAQRCERVGLEARVAGRVDEVDLPVLPLAWQTDAASDICRRCSSSSQSETVDSPSTEPRRFVAPDWKSIASTSEVLPVPRWPTTATFRILLGSNCGTDWRV